MTPMGDYSAESAMTANVAAMEHTIKVLEQRVSDLQIENKVLSDLLQERSEALVKALDKVPTDSTPS